MLLKQSKRGINIIKKKTSEALRAKKKEIQVKPPTPKSLFLIWVKQSMEGLQKAIRNAISKEPSITTATNLPSSSFDTGSGLSSASPSDPTSLLLTRPPRRAVSLLTCSKLCAFCFVAGIIVGYTLKRGVRRWAARLLRRIKDD